MKFPNRISTADLPELRYPTPTSVEKILQNCICKLFEEGISSRLKSCNEVGKIDRAFRQLKKLASGEEPDNYDALTALLYLSWYQFGHVRLVDQIFHHLSKTIRIPNNCETLNIIDLGCGALATQIGFAKFISGYPQQKFRKVHFHNIDKSEKMKQAGERLWNKWTSSWESPMPFEFDFYGEKPSIDPLPGPTILIAMHAIYDRNKDVIREAVKEIKERHEPITAVMTTQINKKSLINEIGREYPSGKRLELECPGTVNTKIISQPRKDLLGKIKKLDCTEFTDIMNKFLDQYVPSWPKKPYVRRLW